MGAMDACNRRFGRGTVVPAAANIERRVTRRMLHDDKGGRPKLSSVSFRSS